MQYLIRWLGLFLGVGIVAALIVPAVAHTRTGNLGWMVLAVIGFIMIILKIVALDIPRFRSIGWSPWLMLLVLIPGVGAILQILLFVMPPKFE
jgi:uncharacterized membrane protein YhaH (DUF805 family)